VQDVVIAGLKTKLNAVPDVRYASSEPDPSLIFQNHAADVVVETWMGGRLYIYLLDKVPKVRDLKATLRENSRCGIGTLFLVDEALLPRQGETVKIEDWHQALYLLNETWIYSYALDNKEMAIHQVHFSPTPYADHFRVWYLNDFTIEACVVRSRSLDEGIRGHWYVGDLASSQYKRRINYERQNQRFHYNTRQTREAAAKLPNEQLIAYYQMLGLGHDASEKDVKKAFRQMALKVHPDVSALPRAESERRIKELNEAYEFIKAYHGWS
jgi:hypothetical protein